MKSFLSIFSFIMLFSSCGKLCHKDLRVGEMLMIPIDFSQYDAREVGRIQVLNVNNGDTFSGSLRDNYLFHKTGREENWLTDNPMDGYYSSDLDGSNLYFCFRLSENAFQMLDSITHIVVKKSQEKVKEPCYKDHPNVQIDALSFDHNGKTLYKNDTLFLRR